MVCGLNQPLKNKIMKKYTNIKSGLVAIESTNNSYRIDESEIFRIPASIIEDSNEWVIVKEKQLTYEIVSLKVKNENCDVILFFNSQGVCIQRTDGLCPQSTFKLSTIIENFDSNIHSIKRLSDGTIFTIGDKLVWDWSASSVDYFELKSFRIEKGEVHLDLGSSGVFEGLFGNTNFNLRHYLLPLFKTEDGVNVYKNNHPVLYWVNKKTFNGGFDHKNSLSDPDTYNYIYFRKKEKAISYIIGNKPVFSLNDIKKVLGSNISGKKLSKFAKKACELNN